MGAPLRSRDHLENDHQRVADVRLPALPERVPHGLDPERLPLAGWLVPTVEPAVVEQIADGKRRPPLQSRPIALRRGTYLYSASMLAAPPAPRGSAGSLPRFSASLVSLLTPFSPTSQRTVTATLR